MVRIFGYTAEEAIGQGMLMILPQERVNEEADILARIGQGQSVEHFETVRVCKDGTRIDVSVTISPNSRRRWHRCRRFEDCPRHHPS